MYKIKSRNLQRKVGPPIRWWGKRKVKKHKVQLHNYTADDMVRINLGLPDAGRLLKRARRKAKRALKQQSHERRLAIWKNKRKVHSD
jgi:hypothetical protein